MGPPRRELPVGQILRETELGPSHPRRLKPSHCPPPSRHLNPPSHNPAMVTSGRKGFNPNKTKRKTWIENGSWNLEAPHDCTCFDCNGMRSLYNYTQFLFQYHDGHLLAYQIGGHRNVKLLKRVPCDGLAPIATGTCDL